jgi:hypothetical protein
MKDATFSLTSYKSSLAPLVVLNVLRAGSCPRSFLGRNLLLSKSHERNLAVNNRLLCRQYVQGRGFFLFDLNCSLACLAYRTM